MELNAEMAPVRSQGAKQRGGGSLCPQTGSRGRVPWFGLGGGRWLRASCVPLLLGMLTFLGAASATALPRGADGKYEKRTSSHFVLFQDVAIDRTSGFHGSRRFEQEVLKVLESAYDRLDDLLGLRPSQPITVIVHDAEIFDQRFGGRFRFPAAGFYGDRIHIRGDVVVHNRLVRTLHHELVHAAFHAKAPSFVLPAWLNEGLAEWFEARALGKRFLSAREYQLLAANAAQGQLFDFYQLSMPAFGGFQPNAARIAYLQSYAFIEYLARRHGGRSLRDFSREYMRIRDLDRAFDRSFRGGLAQRQSEFFDDVLARARL